MFRKLSAVLVAGVVTVAALFGSAGSASAAGISRPALLRAANAVAYEDVGGPLYGRYKNTAGYAKQLNWTHDGCSIPKSALVTAAIISKPTLAAMLVYGYVFVNSCNRHDFGYRNYGTNLSTPGPHPHLQPTLTRKNSIDAKFYDNMKLQCDRDFGWPYVSRTACKVAARGFYLAVNKTSGGRKAFFGS